MTINTNIKPNFPVNYPKAFVKAVYLVSTKQPNVLERAFKIDLATLEENDIFNGVLHNTLNVLQKHTAKYLTDADKKKITDSLETRSSKKALSYLYECLCKRQQQYIVKAVFTSNKQLITARSLVNDAFVSKTTKYFINYSKNEVSQQITKEDTEKDTIKQIHTKCEEIIITPPPLPEEQTIKLNNLAQKQNRSSLANPDLTKEDEEKREEE